MKGKKEGHFAAISGQKVVLIVIRVSDMQFCNDSSTLCFVNAVAMGFAVYKSVFSRQGLNCLVLPEKVFAGKFK